MIGPILFTVLFGFVFGSAIALPGGGNYRQFLMPGIFVQIMALTATNAATKVSDDMQKGIIDRFKSLPIARPAVLLGRTIADLSGHLAGLLCMSLCGVFIAGWRPQRGLADTAGAYGLPVLLGFAIIWIGTLVGLLVKSPNAADTATFSWIFPMTFLANTFVPTQGLPAWLRVIADGNPLSPTVAATRQLFGSPAAGLAPQAWPLMHPVLASALWSLLITAVFLPLAVRRYRRVAPA